MKLTCDNCGNLSRDHMPGEHFCNFWCFSIFDDDQEYKKTSSYFCAEHTMGPGTMIVNNFENKDQLLLNEGDNV